MTNNDKKIGGTGKKKDSSNSNDLHDENHEGIPLRQAAVTFAPLEARIFDGSRSDPPELPLQGFRGWGDWITSAAEKCSCPVDYPAMGLLATASTLIGNARWVWPWDRWKEPPVLWIAAVGDPSSGKSPGLDFSFDFLNTFEQEMAEDFPDKLREYERVKEASNVAKQSWKDSVRETADKGDPAPEMPEIAVEPEPPVRPRLTVSDTTPEALGGLIAAHPKGLLCKRDELAAWLGNFDRYSGGGERAFFIEAYGGRPHTIDRVKNATPLQIKRLTVGVIGGIQPERLADLIAKSADDGFLARFLMCWPNSVPPRRPTGPPVPVFYQDALHRLMELELALEENGDPTPRLMMLSDEAADLLQEWRVENAANERNVFGLMKSHCGKMPGMVIRLALILEYLGWCLGDKPEPSCVSVASVGYAIHLVNEYFKPMAERVYGEAALPPSEKGAAILARRIRRDKLSVVSAKDIRRDWKLPGLSLKEPLGAALAVLIECGVLASTNETHPDGRKKLDYHVNPAIYGDR